MVAGCFSAEWLRDTDKNDDGWDCPLWRAEPADGPAESVAAVWS